jgi:hypothetical protein
MSRRFNTSRVGKRYIHPYKNTAVEIDFQKNPFTQLYECNQKRRNNQTCKKDNRLWYTSTSGDMRNDTIYTNPYVYSRNPYYDFLERGGSGVQYVTTKYR